MAVSVYGFPRDAGLAEADGLVQAALARMETGPEAGGSGVLAGGLL
jgi:hypothetical protein